MVKLLIHWAISDSSVPAAILPSILPSIARSFRARCRFDAFLFLHAKPVSFAPWQHQHLLQLLQGILYPVIQF